jgi:hypothetical protein
MKVIASLLGAIYLPPVLAGFQSCACRMRGDVAD